MASTDLDDDPVERLVELAMQAQTRLMLAYMDNMREELRAHLRNATRREFAGETCYFGKIDQDYFEDRRASVRAQHAAGLSIRQIAKKLGISKTQVGRYLEKGSE